jgi:hypothetical protein
VRDARDAVSEGRFGDFYRERLAAWQAPPGSPAVTEA